MRDFLFFAGGAVACGVGLFIWAWFLERGEEQSIPSTFAAALMDGLPFNGSWLTFWGGERAEDNHHHGVGAQHLAMDFVMTQPGSEVTHRSGGEVNEDYLCWDQPLLAPHAGVVTVATDGIPDNAPGETNEQMVYGNTVMIQHADGFVSVLAHLRCGSVTKRVGDPVAAGERVGLCGNSGNSSEPHLHFHVQSESGFEKGVALRAVFRRLLVGPTTKADWSPTKGEYVSNEP